MECVNIYWIGDPKELSCENARKNCDILKCMCFKNLCTTSYRVVFSQGKSIIIQDHSTMLRACV